MSQIDTDLEGLSRAEQNTLSETEAGQQEAENTKLVPIAESIRYRKRAQGAEKKAELLTEQLAKAKAEAANMSEQLSDIQAEQVLMRKLSAAGTIDLESAVLIAKARLEGQSQADLDSVVEQLKKEKQYLFVSPIGKTPIPIRKTAAAKDRTQNCQTALERAAKKAATTGNRIDLQQYLKLRRNFL